MTVHVYAGMLFQLMVPLRVCLLSRLVFASSRAECADESADCPNCTLLPAPPALWARHCLPLGIVMTLFPLL